MKRRTKDDLGMPMDGQPTLFAVIAPENHAEPVKPRPRTRAVKPWTPYAGGTVGCGDCIAESAYRAGHTVQRATWTRRGQYGDEHICDQHHEKEAA